MKYIILALLLSGCSHFEVQMGFDRLLEPFIREFEVQYGKPLKNTVGAYFGRLSGDRVGTCTISSSGRYITIDADYWNDASYYEKHQLIFHELGHCELLIWSHNDNLIQLPSSDYGPESIMFSSTFGFQSFYPENLDYYLDELFGTEVSYSNKAECMEFE